MKAISLSSFVAGALVLFALPASSASLPGLGNGDALCTVTVGPTDCTVNEGMGDSLVELVVNQLNQKISIDSITAGPISVAVPDPTDNITSDPVSFFLGGFAAAPACNPGVTKLAAGGGTCYFVQRFTTGTPGDPDDGTNIPNDGTSNMSFNLTFTPVAMAIPVGAFTCSNGQGNNVGFCSVVGNANGSFTATIESAVVHVNDVVPEPSSMLLFGTGLVALGAGLKRKLR